jgi:glutamate synthase (NADPH/NADH) large chain
MGVQLLVNMTHRGGVGANPTTGDGAGLMTQLPDALFRADMAAQGVNLPSTYGCGMLFLPQNNEQQQAIREQIETLLADENLPIIGWRRVPTNRSAINDEVAASEPAVWQVFVGGAETSTCNDYERRLYVARKRLEKDTDTIDNAGFYCCSFSSSTVVYKGMFLANQLSRYYADLTDSHFVSALAFVHQRFSTNTFPAWNLAHPYRCIAHNGEINTLRGNVNNMIARAQSLQTTLFKKELSNLMPFITPDQSDTASLDNAVELLCMAGYSPAHALSILIPEAWQGNADMEAMRRDFYRYHAPLMEPWDGPAQVIYSNGRQIAAVLDRNGLRPGRYWLTDDDLIVMASEAGVLNIQDARISQKCSVEPGKMLLVDLEKGRIINDAEIKHDLSSAHPYEEWRQQSQIPLETLPKGNGDDLTTFSGETLLRSQQNYAYTEEDLKFILLPMTQDAAEPLGAMGDDSPTAVLSTRMKPLSTYFRQEFAQVTNPPIDPIREEVVMSLASYLGPRPNLLEPFVAPQTTCITLSRPILTPDEFCRLRDMQDKQFKVCTLDTIWAADDGESGMEKALQALQAEALRAVYEDGAAILILSDRNSGPKRPAIPMLLVAAAVHHHLVREGQRTRVGLVTETGSAREVHDFATLIGYGVEAIYPYLAYASLAELPLNIPNDSVKERQIRYRHAVCKGLLKTMSKMGVSTIQSYCGAQVFEIVGLDSDFVNAYFCGTVSQIGGIGAIEIARETLFWHSVAYDKKPPMLYENALDAGGDYAYRLRGEEHLWTPTSIATLQHAVRTGKYENHKQKHLNLPVQPSVERFALIFHL